MDLVSSIVMLITSRLAAKPNIRKFPVVDIIPFLSLSLVLTMILLEGRKRVETVGIILFCALMTTVAVELIVCLLLRY
jgi:hypothetical protein